MSPARCPDPGPVPSPDIPQQSRPADQKAARPSPGLAAFLPSDIDQLHIRIEDADTHLMRILHLAEVGRSIVVNTPGNWPGIDSLQWIFELLDERIAWARETVITDSERENSACHAGPRRRLVAPQSTMED